MGKYVALLHIRKGKIVKGKINVRQFKKETLGTERRRGAGDRRLAYYSFVERDRRRGKLDRRAV